MDSENTNYVRLEERIRVLESEIAKGRGEMDMMELELGDTKRSMERFQLISDFAYDWEMWYLPDGTVEYISPSFQTITGYAPMELSSNYNLINQIIHPEDLAGFNKYIEDSIGFVTIRQSLRFKILTRTKQLRWCEIKCNAVYDKLGKYLGQRASIGDITNLMQALGQIKDLSKGKQYEEKAKRKYMKDLESKDRELVSFMMSISQKNETLQYAKRQIDNIFKDCDPSVKVVLNTIREHLNTSLASSDSWDSFRRHFESINPGFFDRLSKKFPELTSRDLRICGYIRLGLSTKEIAVLQNITFQSAEISRVRLRKKLSLTRSINLLEFIRAI